MADRKTVLLLVACLLQVLILLSVLQHVPLAPESSVWTLASDQRSLAGVQQDGYRQVEVHMKLEENVRRGGAVQPTAPGAANPDTDRGAEQAMMGGSSETDRRSQDVLQVRWAKPAVLAAGQIPYDLGSDNRKERTTGAHEEAHMAKIAAGNEESSRATKPTAESSIRPILTLLLVVKTGPTYFERREITRNLWLSQCTSGNIFGSDDTLTVEERQMVKQVTVECLFLTGASENSTVMARLREEVAKKGDLFLAPFVDGYGKMTAKTQWCLTWSLVREKRYDYLLMVDDDAYVSFRSFIPWLLEQPRHGFYSGHLHYNRVVYHCAKYPEHPNCVDTPLLKGQRQYPHFASGFAYVISHDVAALSVLEVMRYISEGLPGNVEDAMLGTLLYAAGVSMRDERGFVHWADENRRCPLGARVLIVGNAPIDVLTTLSENDRTGKPICFGI
eukprot:scpid66466/ scgid23914/ Lactosylceramide 1,3-N-acetyl-beta-D-glucosaminyltransferase A; Lactotriaosylceramide synthase A; UDP-GlcNAc:beta-Gal beta-1,3-N-acetylglucosaminyltransferase 5A